jgi:hypothetical protein
LLVDPDAELSAAVAFEGFKTIGGWNLQVIQSGGTADHGELVQGPLLDVKGQSFGVLEIPNLLGFLVGETFQHEWSLCYFRFASIAGF